MAKRDLTKRNFFRNSLPVFTVLAISTFIQIIGTDTALARSSWFCEDYAHGYADPEPTMR